MKPPPKEKWSAHWQACELEVIGKIADAVPRHMGASDLSRWRAAESMYASPEYGYLRARRPKRD